MTLENAKCSTWVRRGVSIKSCTCEQKMNQGAEKKKNADISRHLNPFGP